MIFFFAFSPPLLTFLKVRPAPRVKGSKNQFLLVLEEFKVGHKQFHNSFCELILK